jgi:xanthine dehydrogenase iron-sulfur cluster and FAD-binding subunit A
MPLTAVIAALVVVGAIVGGAIAFASPLIAIPIVLVALLAWLAVELLRRPRRRPLRHQHVQFTDDDWATLAPSETPGDVHISPGDPPRG